MTFAIATERLLAYLNFFSAIRFPEHEVIDVRELLRRHS